MSSFFRNLQTEKRNESRIGRYIFGLVGAVALFFTCFEGRELFDFGFWYGGRFWLFELKTDYQAGTPRSRKVFLETGNAKSNQPSGLTATIADRVLIHCPALSCIYSFPPKPMLDFLTECKACDFLYKTGDQNAKGYLLDTDILAALPFTKVIPYAH